MALVASILKTSLESNWLVVEGGSHPDSAMQSGQMFAQAVANWFASAQALAFPCTTALARQSQLATQAAAALQVGQASSAGAQLAMAVASFYMGQSFGSGVASSPAAASAGVCMIGVVFADLEISQSQRAQQIADACHVMAVSTPVAFPNPPFAGVVM